MNGALVSAQLDLSAFVRSLPTAERQVYKRAGYARRFGGGTHPACVVVDVEYNFTGDDPNEDILSSIAKYSDSCGPHAWAAIPSLLTLLEAVRRRGLPVAFSHGRVSETTRRQPKLGTAVIDELAPRDGELVFEKDAASAFFETELASYLRERDVDTVVVTGCVTSGCVRATVVDAASHGFKVLVPEQCVFDRALTPHLANLFDMDAKYADVISLTETMSYLAEVVPANGEREGRTSA
jgi:nicotinamidase-related amidase